MMIEHNNNILKNLNGSREENKTKKYRKFPRTSQSDVDNIQQDEKNILRLWTYFNLEKTDMSDKLITSKKNTYYKRKGRKISTWTVKEKWENWLAKTNIFIQKTRWWSVFIWQWRSTDYSEGNVKLLRWHIILLSCNITQLAHSLHSCILCVCKMLGCSTELIHICMCCVVMLKDIAHFPNTQLSTTQLLLYLERSRLCSFF